MAIDSPRRQMTPVNSTSAIHRVKSTEKKISKAQVDVTIPKQTFWKENTYSHAFGVWDEITFLIIEMRAMTREDHNLGRQPTPETMNVHH